MKTLSQRRDRFFKHPVRRRVRDHDRRQVVLVFFRLRPKIFQIDVAVLVRLDLRVVSPDAVRIHSKSQEKPPTTSSDGDESRRRRRRVIQDAESDNDALQPRHHC